MSIKLIDDSTLVDIGNAIREKNDSTTKYKPSEMPTAIRALEKYENNNGIQRWIEGNENATTGLFYAWKGTDATPILDGVDFSEVTSTRQMFYYCENLTTVSLFDTSNVTDMSQMFYDCSSLAIIPLFNTSNCVNMGSMFYSTKITTAPPLDTSNVTNMSGMFSNCAYLKSAEIADASKVTSVSIMFRHCSSLRKVKISKIGAVTDARRTSGMFYNCPKLELIYFPEATAVLPLYEIDDFELVPEYCIIVVPDSLFDEWSNAAVWSELSQTIVRESNFINNMGGYENYVYDTETIDLANTVWYIPAGWTTSWGDQFNINCIVNDVAGSMLGIGMIATNQGYWDFADNTICVADTAATATNFLNTEALTITFTANSDDELHTESIFEWLQTNGERIIISFIIDGSTYEAYEGMTWQQWINSDFNTAGYTIKDDMVCNSSNKYLFEHGGVIMSDYYILEEEYYFDSL